MAQLEIAVKANSSLLLPSLLLATHLEQTARIPPLQKAFIDKVDLPANTPIQLTLDDGQAFSGSAILQKLTKVFIDKERPDDASLIEEWVERSLAFTDADFKSVSNHLAELNDHLILRTYIVGYSLSAADLTVWATLRGNRVAYASIKKTANNVLRWFTYIEVRNPWISETVAELTMHATKEKAALSAAGASYEIDLPDITGPMVTRFPPEPSGYLHIGHAKAALLNDFFAHRDGGTLICRFDDTNPSKEKVEFQNAILQDLKSMKVVPDKTTYSSDYFQEMYDLAIKLINDGKAFADDSELGKGDQDRKNRLPSKRRDMGIDETLKHFAEMKTGVEEGCRWCIRARIAYDSPNGTLRDPVIYRCNLLPHHRTGTEWKIYPTYDFCAPILDSLEGITVALRTNEYRDRNVQYEWMQNALGLRPVTIWDFSRMNFVRTVLSKRKLTKIVDDGKVWDWNDPRMPTIQGLLRRGLTVAALRKFILKQGPSRNVLNLEWGALWALNKKIIDPLCRRYTAIEKNLAVKCLVRQFNGPLEASKPFYVKNPELGTKTVRYAEEILIEQVDAQTFEMGEEITLMNWGNAYIRNITKSPDGPIAQLDLELHLEGDVKKTKKFSWLAATDKMQPVELVTFDHLLTKDKLEKEDRLEDFLATDTESRADAWADSNVLDIEKGTIIQFERKGFYILDVPAKDGKMVFFEVPSGKS